METEVLIVIVKRTRTVLMPEVIKPVSNYPILVVDRPSDYPSDPILSCNITRSIAQMIVKYNRSELYPKYIFMLDSDCVIPNNSIEILINKIKPHETLCIPTKGSRDPIHIVCSACLIELNDYLNVNFNEPGCHCNRMPNPRYIDGIDGYEIEYDRT